MKPKLFIGIDPASDTGYAAMDLKGNLIESGTWRLKPVEGALNATRWKAFGAEITSLIRRYKADYSIVLTYEWAPYQKGNRAALMYGGWMCMLDLLQAEHSKVAWQYVTVADWKTAFCGNSRAKKPEYIAMANKKYKKTLKNKKGLGGEDEAAAIGVAYASIVLRTMLAAQGPRK